MHSISRTYAVQFAVNYHINCAIWFLLKRSERFNPSIMVSSNTVMPYGPIPAAARSKAWVCGRWCAGTEGSNTAAGMDVRLLCVLSCRSIRDELITRPEQSYRLWRVVVCDV
jgi:hypothetical protein